MSEDTIIKPPVLDGRSEVDRIAARIHRSVGNLTEADADLVIAYGERLKQMIASSGAVGAPLLPEFTSIRPPEAHIILLTMLEQAFTDTVFRIDQVPDDKVRVALLELLGVRLLPASASTTTLEFTKVDDFHGVDVTVPAGIEVTTEERDITVLTREELVIPAGEATGTVQAVAAAEGDVRLPANTLGLALQSLAGIASVTNTAPLAGGADAETVDQGKVRAGEEFEVPPHLGSARDYEKFLTNRVLRGKGRVKAFEGYTYQFTRAPLGYILITVQGADGLAPSDELLTLVRSEIRLRHVAGIYVAARAPIYKSFSLEVGVKIAAGQSPATLINKAKSNLAARFGPLRFEYGPEFGDRFISLSDVVGQVEAAGPSQISVASAGNRFDVTVVIGGQQLQQDVVLGVGELPQLESVTLRVVN